MNRRFQFSLKWLLGVPAFCGMAIAAFTLTSQWQRTLAIHFLQIVAFGCIASMLFSRRRYLSAFAIGGAFPAITGAALAVMPLLGGPSFYGDGSLADLVLANLGDSRPVDHENFKFRAAFLLAATLLGGLAGMAVRLLDSHKEEK
jgi:hypothetical protein